MGSRERQERERESVRQAILCAARDLFVDEGYRNVSMRKIAERIEYSPAAIYSYFARKDDIFFALAEEGFRILANECQSAVRDVGDPLQRLRSGLWAFYQFSKRYPQYFELMFVDRSVPSLSQDFQRFEFFRATTIANAEADVRAGMNRGELSARLDPAAALHVLWVGVLGAATIAFAGRLGPDEDPDALAHDTLNALLAGFTTDIATTFVASECAFTDARHADAGAPETKRHPITS